MNNTYLWQQADFPHFYCNPAVMRALEEEFQVEVAKLDSMLRRQDVGFDDVFTEEIGLFVDFCGAR